MPTTNLPPHILSREQIRSEGWRSIDLMTLPGVASLAEVDEAKATRILDRSRERLNESDYPVPHELRLGQAAMTQLSVSNMDGYEVAVALYGRDAPEAV